MKHISLLIFFILISCKQEAQNTVAQRERQRSSDFHIEERIIRQKEFNRTESTSAAFQNSSEVTSKKNGKIELSLKNKSKIVLSDNEGQPYDEDRITYTFLGSISDFGKYLIKADGYEGDYYLLIDKMSGAADTTLGLPYFSPDGKFIFSGNHNPYETYENIFPPTEDVSIYEYKNGKLNLIFSKPYTKGRIEEIYWKDKNTVHFKIAEKSAVTYHALTVTDKAQGVKKAKTLKNTFTGIYRSTHCEPALAKGCSNCTEFNITIKEDSCTFVGSGYQLYFEALCTPKIKNDTLELYFERMVSGSSSISDEKGPVVTIYRRKNKIYAKSPLFREITLEKVH